MKPYVLSPAAERDLLATFRHGVRNFGLAQAAAYQAELTRTVEIIAEHPTIARERTEFSKAVRIHHHGRHYIVYVARKDHIRIVRVLRDDVDLGRHFRRLA